MFRNRDSHMFSQKPRTRKEPVPVRKPSPPARALPINLLFPFSRLSDDLALLRIWDPLLCISRTCSAFRALAEQFQAAAAE